MNNDPKPAPTADWDRLERDVVAGHEARGCDRGCTFAQGDETVSDDGDGDPSIPAWLDDMTAKGNRHAVGKRAYGVLAYPPPGTPRGVGKKRSTRLKTEAAAIERAEAWRRRFRECTVVVTRSNEDGSTSLVTSWDPMQTGQMTEALSLEPSERRNLKLAEATIIEHGWKSPVSRGTWDGHLWWQEVGYRQGWRDAARCLSAYGLIKIPPDGYDSASGGEPLRPLGEPGTQAPALNLAPPLVVSKCPCCDGWGQRERTGAASSSACEIVPCPACSGKGVVWA